MMATTKAQRDARTGYIGSSHAAGLLGVDPYTSAYDVWGEITGKVGPKKMTEVMELGQLLEPAVIDWLEKKLGKQILRQIDVFKGHVLHRGPDYCGAHLDGLLPDEIVEAKTSGLHSFLSPDWGASGTDEVPHKIIVQVHHQMLVTGLKLAHVPALVPPRGMQHYIVERNEEIIDTMLEVFEAFWTNCVMADKPPSASLPSVGVVKRWRREPNRIVEVSSETVRGYLRFKDEEKNAAMQKDFFFQKLGAELGSAEGANFDGGLITYYADKNGTRRLNIKQHGGIL